VVETPPLTLAELPEKTVEHVPEWEQEAPPRRHRLRLNRWLPERAPEPAARPQGRAELPPEPPPRLHRVPEPGAYIAVIWVGASAARA
jgi:hypothetical protein